MYLPLTLQVLVDLAANACLPLDRSDLSFTQQQHGSHITRPVKI